jgi:hypothetical protein
MPKKTPAKKKTSTTKGLERKAAAPRAAVRRPKPQRPSRKTAAPAFVPEDVPAAPAQFAGFDTGSYPGDSAINEWAAQSPYSFVGFYFDAPCHTTKTFKTWSGKFPIVKASGLGLIIIYVGLQQDGCGQAHLSRARGLEHGTDTINKFTTEGFPDNAIVFLDVEHYNGSLSAPMEDYIRGWISSILDSGKITTGIYCPASKADEIRLAAEKEFAAHGLPGGTPAFWVVNLAEGFDVATSQVADSGVAFASAWQGRIKIVEAHGGVTITIDQNVADTRDPSRAT